MLSIGELSRKTGVKIPTIRYYEQMGLIEAAERSEGNQRRFGRSELDRLSFIRHARDLGIGIDAIRDLIELSGHPDSPCEDADKIAADQLVEVRERIKKLQNLERELERMASHCKGETVGECYVLRSLSDHGMCDHEH